MPADSEFVLAARVFLAKAKTHLSPAAIEQLINITSNIAKIQTLSKTYTLRAILELCKVLKGHHDLLEEFKLFLPKGYTIDVQGEEIHVHLDEEAAALPD